MPHIVSEITASVAHGRMARPLGVLIAVIGLGLALTACTKCDVPNLIPNKSAPQSCHDGPSAQ